jgi:hypothetical protein
VPALYRHCHATGLFDRRDANLKLALARFIDRGFTLKPTPAAFVAAIATYAKLNSSGQLIDKVETVHPTSMSQRELFARMTRAEMLLYAETGELPGWWPESEKGLRVDGNPNG